MNLALGEARAELDRRRLARQAELKRRREAYPLGWADLWHQEPPRTSQRAALLGLCDPSVTLLCILGGNRCLGGEVEVFDIDRNKWRPIAHIAEPITTWASNPNTGERQAARAFPVERKGPDPLYRVELSDGSSFTATAAHQVLTVLGGWASIAALGVGARLSGGLSVASIGFDRYDYHYDLSVPGFENFEAAGCIHHNTGKSELLAQLLIAMAAGRDAEVVLDGRRVRWVELWLHRNGLPFSMIPDGPAVVWSGSPSFGSAVQQIRPKLHRYAPAGTTFKAWDDPRSEGLLILPNGGQVVSKAYKQFDHDNQSWEGANVRFIGLDEQPNSYENLGAALSRLVDQNGKIAISLTPLRGKSDWFYREIVHKAPPWVRVVYLHGADNPHIPQEARERMLAAVPKWQRLSRDVGGFTQPEGAIYPFDRGVHVVPRFTPPPDWLRWVGIDWGARAPHVVWAAEDPQGNLYAYRELCPRRTTLEPGVSDRRLIEWVIEMELEDPAISGNETVIYRVADSEAPGAIVEAAEQGLLFAPAKKGAGSVVAGIDLTEALLLTQDPQTFEPVKPRLYIMDCCPQLIEEVEGLCWLDDRPADDPKPDPACPDHGPDALRYIIQYRQELGFR